MANAPAGSERRDRVIVTVGGVLPDIDGLGIVPDVLTRHLSATPTGFFHDYHHLLGHNVGFALLATAGAFALARKGARAATAALFALAFHLHLLCDLVGARGPDGNPWPIAYLEPFSARPQLQWSGQWELNAWPNFAITFALLVAVLWFALRRGRTIVEVVSQRADAAVVEAVRARFGCAPREAPPAGEESSRGN